MMRSCCSGRLRKVNEVTADVKPVSGTSGRWQHPQRSGTPQIGVLGRAYGKQIVAANVHNHEGVAGDETAPICTWFKSMALNVDRRLGDEIGLIFFLHRA